MAGGVQQVDGAAAVVELEHGGGNGDAPLLLQFHPVGGHLALLPLGLHSPCLLNRPPVEEKLFRQGGLAGVGVGNDRKIPAPGHGLGQIALAWGWSGGGGRLGRGAHPPSLPADEGTALTTGAMLTSESYSEKPKS